MPSTVCDHCGLPVEPFLESTGAVTIFAILKPLRRVGNHGEPHDGGFTIQVRWKACTGGKTVDLAISQRIGFKPLRSRSAWP